MTNNTDTQTTTGTAILILSKNGMPKTSQRYANFEMAENARAALTVYLPGFTGALIRDETDKETANDRGVRFEVESSENGKIKHGIFNYGLARDYAKRYATETNTVTIRQLAPVEVEADEPVEIF